MMLQPYNTPYQDLAKDLSSRYHCPCHNMTVTYEFDWGTIEVSTQLKTTDQKFQSTIFKVTKVVQEPFEVEIQPVKILGVAAKSKMSFICKIKTPNADFNAIKLLNNIFSEFQEAYNKEWGEKFFAYDGHTTH